VNYRLPPLSAAPSPRAGRDFRIWLALLTVVLFGAFVLRLWNLGTQSLWHDEAWSVMSAYQPLRPIDPNYPPFFTVLLGAWVTVAGDSVWAMRYWSLLFGVATVAVVALAARRWFGKRAAIIAATLVAVSPLLWVYAQEIRSYVLIPIQVTILLALAEALLRPRDRIPRRVWVWLALVEIIMLYTHNLAVPVVAWLNVVVVVVFLQRRDWPRLRTWVLSQAGLFVLYLPWLVTQRSTGTPLNTPPTVGLALLWDIWQSYFTGIKALVGADSQLMALTAALGVMTLAGGLALLAYRRLRWTWLVLSQAILIPVFEVIIILAAHIDFHPRYFLAGLPATLILMAAGLDTLMRRRLLSGLGTVSTLVLAIGIMARVASLVYSSPIYQHDDFRAIAQHYATLGPDDAIIIPYGWEPTLDYYSRKMNFKARLIGIPLHSSADTIIDRLQTELKGVQRVELLTWFQLPADVRGAYPCLIGAVKEQQDTLTVNGLQSIAYAGPKDDSQRQPSGGLKIDFSDIELTDVQTEDGPAGICVITRWQLQKHSRQDWQITVRAQNSLGWELARTDTALLSDLQLPTSFWAEGQTESAFSRLKLPDGVPDPVFLAVDPSAVIYPIVVSVYSQDTPHGLDALKDGKAITKSPIVSMTVSAAFMDTPVQITDDDIYLFGGLYLHRKDIPEGQLQPGQAARITLEWRQTPLNLSPFFGKVTVSLEGKGWRVSSESTLFPQTKLLTWHELHIPATASGHAFLVVTAPSGRSVMLGEYDIAPIKRTFAEPAMLLTQRVESDFVGVGTLIGAAVTQGPVSAAQPPTITLLWKAAATPEEAYTVFVHLLDANGQVVAQDDAQPVGGSRPTTSWVSGEYLTDAHKLTFNRPDYRGLATLEIGLYDQTTGDRVKLADGSDHVILPGAVEVK
jgi:4-amino-4-deoxy-L-arabinose transferase-like glycosyltransferase